MLLGHITLRWVRYFNACFFGGLRPVYRYQRDSSPWQTSFCGVTIFFYAAHMHHFECYSLAASMNNVIQLQLASL